jgi:hypothetical protein
MDHLRGLARVHLERNATGHWTRDAHSTLHSATEAHFLVEMRQEDDPVLIAAGGVNDGPCAWRAALVAGRMQDVRR